jgi:hypothetical protein
VRENNSKFIEDNMMDSNFPFDLLPYELLFPDEHFYLNFVFVCRFMTTVIRIMGNLSLYLLVLKLLSFNTFSISNIASDVANK